MLNRSQEKLVRAVMTKKGREKTGRCLVEGPKLLEEAGDLLDFYFDQHTTEGFKDIVTTDNPQQVAGIARIPNWADEVLMTRPVLIVLDGVQDPANVGAAFRLALGFDAALILTNSADPTSPKVIRSSAGAIFHAPWRTISTEKLPAFLKKANRPIYRLEKRGNAKPVTEITHREPVVLVVGSEGQGIQSAIDGASVFVPHRPELESLNVTHALAIALYEHSRVV